MADDLTRERFGAIPWAERYRPLREEVGDGRPDTPEAIETRRRALARALKEEQGRF